MKPFAKIMVIDDDPLFNKSFSEMLELLDYSVRPVLIPQKALEILQEEKFDCIILDIQMPGINGIELLKSIMPYHYDTPIIILSERYNKRQIIEALKLGAFDFIDKSDDPEIIIKAINRALDYSELKSLQNSILQNLENQFPVIAKSKSMQKVMDAIHKAAKTDAPVLLLGETGVGKTYLARTIHHLSDRALKPFHEVTIINLPETLIETELFGYKKGAFTGATKDKPGILEIANGGTVFFDEIGELPLYLQPKLNQFLDSRTFYPVGSTAPVNVDVRLIFATNRQLDELRKKGQFRDDLFYRISAVSIAIPPLRERVEDIWPLANHFFKKHQKFNPVVKGINPRCRTLLEHYYWPGNVRELENKIIRLIVLSEGKEIDIQQVIKIFREEMDAVDEAISSLLFTPTIQHLKNAREEFEKFYIQKALNLTENNLQQAAQLLGIDRTNLYRKIKKYGL